MAQAPDEDDGSDRDQDESPNLILTHAGQKIEHRVRIPVARRFPTVSRRQDSLGARKVSVAGSPDYRRGQAPGLGRAN